MHQILLNHGAPFSISKSDAEAFLTLAVHLGDLEMVEFCIDHDAFIDGENSDKEALLICAIRHGDTEICQFLRNYLRCASKKDHLKMFQAAWFGKTEICKLLVQYGVDINLIDIVENEMKNDIVTWRETFGKN